MLEKRPPLLFPNIPAFLQKMHSETLYFSENQTYILQKKANNAVKENYEKLF